MDDNTNNNNHNDDRLHDNNNADGDDDEDEGLPPIASPASSPPHDEDEDTVDLQNPPPAAEPDNNNNNNDTTTVAAMDVDNDDDDDGDDDHLENENNDTVGVPPTPQRPLTTAAAPSSSSTPRRPPPNNINSNNKNNVNRNPLPNDLDSDDESIVPPTPMPPPRRRDIDDHGTPLSVPPTPLSPLADHHHQDHQPALQQQQQQQQGSLPQVVEMEEDDNADDDDLLLFAGPLGGGETVIRGTDVHVPTAAAAFTGFLREFRSLEHSQRVNQRLQRLQQRRRRHQDDSSDSDNSEEEEDDTHPPPPPPPPMYLSKLEALVVQHSAILDSDGEMTTKSLDIDTMHLFYHNQACQRLYYQLVAYPMEIVPLFDLIVKKEMERLATRHAQQQQQDQLFAPPTMLLQVRPYHLRTISNLRCLDPVSMDSLMSIRGMVVRTSPIIPDLKVAHFSCTICGHEHQVTIDRGRIHEPHRCPSCTCRDSYQLVHNRSVFADKQLVRIQETPDEVPAGQTPASVLTFCFDDLVDAVQPGDRVEVTGVMRAQPRRVHPKMTRLNTVYKTYLDVIHFRRINGMESNNNSNNNINANGDANKTTNSNDRNITTPRTMSGTTTNTSSSSTGAAAAGRKAVFIPERIAQLQTLSQQPDIYEQLVSSLAPSIWGLDNVKKGVLCMLFGGNQVRVKKGTAAQQSKKKQRRDARANRGEEDNDDDDDWSKDDEDEQDDDDDDGTSKLNKRGDINILLCGDPGTSKSQLLTYVNKLSTRGVYTSGKGSSAVGLTASVVRDPETRDLVLESGALVLSDLGICCIDEFDKMSDTTRSVLHEAMEQQTVSIAKAGIIANLNARTSILASANPTESRYNPSLSVVENIKLPPTLLSRFDLIYLILDSPQVEQDRRLAQHMVGLYYETPNVVQPPLDQDLLRDYIEYARQYIHPELTEEASDQLVASYLEMRNPPGGNPFSNGMRTISATTRQLESLIRISEGLAKMRFSPVVTRADVWEAVRLMKVATQAAATDPRTGRIDMDMINSGRSTADREMDQNLNLVLKELLAERRGNRMAVRDVTRQLSEIANLTFPHDHVMDALRRLEADGIIQLNERAQTIFVRAGIVS